MLNWVHVYILKRHLFYFQTIYVIFWFIWNWVGSFFVFVFGLSNQYNLETHITTVCFDANEHFVLIITENKTFIFDIEGFELVSLNDWKSLCHFLGISICQGEHLLKVKCQPDLSK
jgi:hypothetical protein